MVVRLSIALALSVLAIGAAGAAGEPKAFACNFTSGVAHVYEKGQFVPEKATPLSFGNRRHQRPGADRRAQDRARHRHVENRARGERHALSGGGDGGVAAHYHHLRQGRRHGCLPGRALAATSDCSARRSSRSTMGFARRRSSDHPALPAGACFRAGFDGSGMSGRLRAWLMMATARGADSPLIITSSRGKASGGRPARARTSAATISWQPFSLVSASRRLAAFTVVADHGHRWPFRRDRCGRRPAGRRRCPCRSARADRSRA